MVGPADDRHRWALVPVDVTPRATHVPGLLRGLGDRRDGRPDLQPPHPGADLHPETAWRLLFALGVLPALGVFWIRRHVPEPDVFVRHADRRGDRPSFLGIFRPGLLRTTVVCALLCTGAQGGYYALTTFLPQFLRTARGLDVLGIGGTRLLVIIGALAGYLFGAWLTDRLGRRPAPWRRS